MKWISMICCLVVFSSCATAPFTGRKQFVLVSDEQLSAMGTHAFAQMLQQAPTTDDPETSKYVQCVTQPIVDSLAVADKDAPKDWNLAVIKDPTPNAFALPGGNIGVHTGLLKVAKTDGELATVIGHELGHVIGNHSGERLSQTLLAQGGLTLVNGFLLSNISQGKQQMIMAALGLGAQVGLLLPWGRNQETEADIIGVNLMAQAGYDPRESVPLWQNMIAETKGQAPPEFLSTHPASENRIKRLEEEMPKVYTKYQDVQKSKGRSIASSSQCQRPSAEKIQALSGTAKVSAGSKP